MSSRSLADTIVERVRRLVEEYIVTVIARDSIMVKYANGEVTVTQAWRDYVVSIYMAKAGRISASTFTSRDPVEAAARTATLIEKLQPSPLYAPLPQPTGKPSSTVDPKVRDLSLSGDAARLVEDVDVSRYGDVAGMNSLEYSKAYMMGSNGLDAEFEVTSFSGYMRVFRGESSGQWAWVSTRYEPALALKAIDKAGELASLCSTLPLERIASGTYRVLLSPMVAGNLMERVAFAASAGSVIFGFSFLQGRQKGDVIASGKLTLREIPLDPSLPGYRSVDDEGVATRDKAIIERGVFKGLLHNTKTAKLMGEESTGNAGWILPRIFNLEIEGGSLREEELLEALGDGIYATNNWYTRFQNYLEGTFSTVTRDALLVVRGGKPIACARRARLTGRLPELIASIEDLSRERWPIQWWEVDTPFIIPHVIVSKLGVTMEG
ncbi:MAG: TldD/PmbA family protein [Desulfurococcaceae archaeon]|nr:TldD/PmbA family protein [Desulfurococcaceae archaeon]